MKHARDICVPNAVLPMMVAGFACLLFCLQAVANAYDNDMWWILATGREVVQNGIPQTNPFTMHEGFDIVLQQWLACVIAYLLYAAFGMAGLRVLVFAQAIVFVGCLYALCRVCSGRRSGGAELYLAVIAIAFSAFAAYTSVRPHLYSMTLFTLVMFVMELYRRSGKPLVLLAVPLLVAIHVNLHAAMAPYDLVIVAAYLIPDVLGMAHPLPAAGEDALPKRAWGVSLLRSDYPRLPVLAALAGAGVALLANPYGINGALYTLNSYGAASYGSYINEMGATGIWTSYGFCALVMTCLGCIALGKNGLRRINLPATLLFLAAIPLSFMHTRNVWLVALFAVPLIAQALGRASLWVEKPEALHSVALRVVAGVILAGATVVYCMQYVVPSLEEDYEKDSASVPVAACDYLDALVEEEGLDKASLRIYNPFNCGGYLEWRGYKVFIDPRPELFEPGITGVNRHYYQEFVDFAQGKTTTSLVPESYDFDFLVANGGSDLADYLLRDQDTYQVVAYGDGYRLWGK